MLAISKAADLNKLFHGDQLFWAFPFSKGSLVLQKVGAEETKGEEFTDDFYLWLLWRHDAVKANPN